jgi:hypothetical protein
MADHESGRGGMEVPEARNRHRQSGHGFDHPTGGGNRAFTWNNNHTKPEQYKYAVRVANDAARAEIDPTVMND